MGSKEMKRFILIILLCCILCSCSEDEGRVKVIPGAGMANSSMMTGFSKLCEGNAEVFIPSDNALVSSRMSSGRAELYYTELTTGKEKRILSTVWDSPLHIQAWGSQLLADQYLVSMDTGTVIMLPELPSEYAAVKKKPVPGKNYIFSEEGEVLFANPYYYLEKFITQPESKYRRTGMLNKIIPPALLLGDKAPSLIADAFKGITAPELEKINDYSLLLSQAKFVFTGLEKDTGDTRLYCFDLLTKKFHLLDSGVSFFEANPGTNKIAYAKNTETPGSLAKLMICEWDGSGKKELVSRQQILGFRWSKNGNWLAFSGGDKNRCDIWITDITGERVEQLTYGMFSTDKLAWSAEGNLLAFTSRQEVQEDSSSVYIITLNMKDPAELQPDPTADTAKHRLSMQLRDLMRQETALLWKAAAKNKEGS
jgi:hypothetical protein